MTFLDVRVPELQKYNQEMLDRFKSLMTADAPTYYNGLEFTSTVTEITETDDGLIGLPSQFIPKIWLPFCRGPSQSSAETIKQQFRRIKEKDLLFMHILRSLSTSYNTNDDVYRLCTWILNEHGPELCITKTGPCLVLKCIMHYGREPQRPRIAFERFISSLLDRFHVEFRPSKAELESILHDTFSTAIYREIENKLA